MQEREVKRKALMAASKPEIGELIRFSVYFNWSWAGCGFGEFFARKNPDANDWAIDDECMGPENVRKILYAAVDKFVDEQMKAKYADNRTE